MSRKKQQKAKQAVPERRRPRPKGTGVEDTHFGMYDGDWEHGDFWDPVRGWHGNKDPKFGAGTVYSTGGKKHFSAVFAVKEGSAPPLQLPVYGMEMDVNAMKTQYGHTTKRNEQGVVETFITVPVEHWLECTQDVSPFGRSQSPLMCTYDAVDKYCESLMGVRLCTDDRDFFKTHPLVETDGVPFQHTLRVVQELIDPYGLRISRVQVAPGLSLKGDILQWRKVLGINPMALTDRQTTNKDFGQPGDYRFEYHTEALFPAVSCGIVGYAENGVSTGQSGGHATYVPPRRRALAAMLSFQIDRAEHVLWKKQPVFEPVAEHVAIIKTSYDADEWWRKFKDSNYKGKAETLAAKVQGTVTKWMSDGKKPTPGIEDLTLCRHCSRHSASQRHTFGVPGLCDDCWSQLFCRETDCTSQACKDAIGRAVPRLKFVELTVQSGIVHFECNRCKTVYYIDKTASKKMKKLIEALIEWQVDFEIEEARVEREKKAKQDAASAAPAAIPATDQDRRDLIRAILAKNGPQSLLELARHLEVKPGNSDLWRTLVSMRDNDHDIVQNTNYCWELATRAIQADSSDPNTLTPISEDEANGTLADIDDEELLGYM